MASKTIKRDLFRWSLVETEDKSKDRVFFLEESKLVIRKADIGDIKDILAVENLSFTTPWSEEAFYNELTNNKFAYYYVLELDEEIIGYAGMWVIFDEAHVTNVAVLPKIRGKKLGELLMRHLMNHGKFLGASKMTLEVRTSNEVAQNLYKKLNFTAEGIRKNYYADTMEDAIIMWVNL